MHAPLHNLKTICFVLIVFVNISCSRYDNYQIENVTFINVALDAVSQESLKNSAQIDNYLVLMSFNVKYIARAKGIFKSSVEPGLNGIKNKITDISFTNQQNQILNEEISVVNCKCNCYIDQKITKVVIPIQSLNLNNFTNLTDMIDKINKNDKSITGLRIRFPILVSIPKQYNFFHFRIDFEDGTFISQNVDFRSKEKFIIRLSCS